jgi:hypothetical protein
MVKIKYSLLNKSHRAILTYYKYINPWIRYLLLVPILYFVLVSFIIVTYRNDTFVLDIQQNQIGYNATNPISQLFHLRDLGFDFIPAVHGSAYISWRTFTDFTPFFFTALVLFLNIFIYKDIMRLTEYVAYIMILMAMNGLVHLVTTYPDAAGKKKNI